MKEFAAWYEEVLKKPPTESPGGAYGFPPGGVSDQSAHLPFLQFLASLCGHVTEFGCREGETTLAFAKGLSLSRLAPKKLISVDQRLWPSHQQLAGCGLPVPWELWLANVVAGDWVIEPTDLLHVDDLHTFAQVEKELTIHGRQVKRFLSFHDVISQGETSTDSPGEEGIKRAILEYASANGFSPVYRADFNNGLWVFEKQV